MNRESLTQMRLDRRLLRRKGWISTEELQKELEGLPDAAAKATTLGEADATSEGPAAAEPSA